MPAVAALVDLVRALAKQSNRYTEAARRQLGMNTTDLTALGLVYDRTKRGIATTPGELAVELDLTPSATTALVDRLECAGHLTRAPHQRDGRRVVLQMTDTAEEVGRTAFAPLGRQISEALADRTPEQLALAAEVLASIIASMDQATSAMHDAAIGRLPGDDVPIH